MESRRTRLKKDKFNSESILQGLTTAVVVLDLEFNIVQLNTAAENLLGISQRQAYGAPVSASFTPPDEFLALCQRVIETGLTCGAREISTRVGDRETLLDYMSKNYSPDRMVISAAGAVNHDSLVSLVESKFGHLTGNQAQQRTEAKYVGGKKLVSRDLEQVHLTVGFDSLSVDDQDFYALQIFSTLLGGGMSSRLFQEVRERRGLAYSVFTFTSAYIDGGSFGVYVGASNDQLKDLVNVLAEQMRSSGTDITINETDRARAQLKSSLLMSLESTSSRCERLARQTLIFGKPISIPDMIRQLDKVSVEDIKNIAERVIFASASSTAILGPIDISETSAFVDAAFGSN